ncbi:MAG TPA: hypothetical protein VFU21_02210 [Kofleriaceae bacterium]|nr:hypothetical protein [Kofleriaceae bacterium]
MKVTRSLSRMHALRLLAFALLAGALLSPDDSSAHHVVGHDQNPSPPPPLASTEMVDFAAGSLVIPMDGCYARPSFMSGNDLDQVVAPAVRTDLRCNRSSEMDDGLIPSYSLVMRLVNAGIPVNWSIRGSKSSFNDIDFTIVKASGAPVHHRLPGGSSDTTRYSALTAINYRGAPWIIDQANASAALALMDSLANVCDGVTCYSHVDVHIAQADFTAPVFKTVETIPKLAIIDVDDPVTDLQNPQTNFLRSSIQEAIMNDLEGVNFEWLTIDEVLADGLTAGGFKVAWIPSFDLRANTPVTARQSQFLDKLSAFADGNGSLLFQDGAVGAMEGWGTMSGMTYTETGATVRNFMTEGAGIVANGTVGTWDNGNDSEIARGQDYSDPAAQFGGIVWTGIGGSKYNWKPRYDFAYQPGVRRMIYSDSTSNSAYDQWDFATWRYKDNDDSKGVIFYLGGFNWRRNTASGFRVLLNTLFFDNRKDVVYDLVEVSRSAPIIASAGGTESHFQASLEVRVPQNADDPDPVAPTFGGASSANRFEFPFHRGHLRAVPVSAVAETATSIDAFDSAAIFDAGDAGMIPTPNVNGCSQHFTAACRTVFTHTTSPDASGLVVAPTRVFVNTTNLALLKPWMADGFTDADATTLISRVLAGVKNASTGEYEPRLGGVDRSTMAIIEPSPLIAGIDRPTMIYVGALDGMLHALCAEVKGACSALGQELWAYIPRSQLAHLKFNTGRIDGSPKVADVFDDFDGDQRKEWRTILTVQTAAGATASATLQPGVVALDITDPTDPRILWARTPPDTPGTVDLGVGLNTAMAMARVAGELRSLTFVETNNGGTGGPGVYLGAYDTANGALVWKWEHLYPAPRDITNPALPGSGIPGGVVAYDIDGEGGMATHVAVPTLYGDLWIFEADGDKPYGTSPAFRFSTDFHPIGAAPTVFGDLATGRLHLALVSGGYADPAQATWSLLTETQYAVAIVGDPAVASAPIDEADPAFGTERRFVSNLGTNRAFSQAIVSGNELFVTTDSTDVNLTTYGTTGVATGQLRRYSLTDGAQKGTEIVIAGGASSTDVSTPGGVVHVGSGGQMQKVNVETTGGGGAFESQGRAIERNSDEATERLLWLSS